MAQAYAEYRDFAAEPRDGAERNAGFVGRAGTGRDDDARRLEPDRRIQVEWAPLPGDAEKGNAKAPTYPVKLTVLCDDRAGLLKEFTAIISDDGTNIRSSASDSSSDGGAVVDFVIETVDVRHLNRLVEKLRRVQGVRDVQRVQKI